MQKYKCHKEVWAVKIAAIERLPKEPEFKGALCRSITGCGSCERCRWRADNPQQLCVIPEDAGEAPVSVGPNYLSKHNPKVGGYYVRYADGYESFSPADAFEDGYTKV